MPVLVPRRNERVTDRANLVLLGSLVVVENGLFRCDLRAAWLRILPLEVLVTPRSTYAGSEGHPMGTVGISGGLCGRRRP